MRILMKIFFGTAVLGAILVGAGIAYLTLMLNPNDYKSTIEQLARTQGIPLHLDGDVSWQFYPNIGLSVTDVSLQTGQQPVLMAKSMSAMVAAVPLLRREVVVQGIELDGVHISLLVNAQGVGNWASLIQPQSVPALPATPLAAVDQDLTVVIKRLVISDASLSYEDKTQEIDVRIDNLNVMADQINTTGQPFNWRSDFQLLSQGRSAVAFQSSGHMAVNLESQQLLLSPLRLNIGAENHRMSMNLEGQVDLATMASNLNVTIAPMNVHHWLTQLGTELPPMAAKDALHHLQLSSQLVGLADTWTFNDLDILMDKSHFTGSASVGPKGVQLNLSGDQLDVDRYLSPAPTHGDKTASAKKSVPLSDAPLPLGALNNIIADADLKLERLTMANLDVQQVQLRASVQQGLLQLTQLEGDFYDGTLAMTGSLDARKVNAAVVAKGQLQQVSLQPLLRVLAEENRLEGQADIDFNINAQGQSLLQWQRSTLAGIELQVSQLTIQELDVEQNFCEIAALLNQKPLPPLKWQGLTRLQDVVGTLTVKGTKVMIKRLQAGVEDLRLKASGGGDYNKGNFDIKADVTVTGIANTERECQVRDRWRNVDLPLRCKGDVDSLSARTCKPDKDRIDDLIRDQLKDAAEAKVKTKLEDKINEKLGEGAGDILRGIFGR